MRFKMARFNPRVFILFTFILALGACSSGDTDEFRTAVYVNDLDVVSIEIPLTDTQSRLHVTDNRQFALSVRATLGDGSTQTISRFLQWSSSAPEVISVNGAGVATALTAGTSTITARLGEYSAEVNMTSSDAMLESIEIISAATTVPVCSFEQTLSVLGTYDDDAATTGIISPDRVVWSSSAQARAVVQNVNEVPTILALASGDATLTATVTLSDSTTLEDDLALSIDASTLTGISITPNPATIPKDGIRDFVATATYSDLVAPGNTRNITRASVWSSNEETILDPVNATPGRFRALDEGSAIVTASCGGRSATADVTVTERREIDGLEIRDPSNVARNLIEKDPLDGDFQLRAWLRFTDDSYEEVTDDEDTEWSIKSSTVSGVLTVGNDEDLDNKGEVELLNREGRVVIEVRARGEVDEITIDVDFDN